MTLGGAGHAAHPDKIGVLLHVRLELAVRQVPVLLYHGHRHGRRQPAGVAVAPGKAQGGPVDGAEDTPPRLQHPLCPCVIDLWF